MIERLDRQGVALLRLEHGKVNALDLELLAALSAELERIEDEAVEAVVLSGTGSSFSAGVDLLRVLEGGRPYLEEFLPRLTTTLLDLVQFPRPVVAAINGHAIAGGFILACACDHRILAAGAAKLGVTELLVGVIFPAVALELVRSVGGRRTAEMCFSGRLYGADCSLAMGLVDEVVEADSLMARAEAVARQWGGVPAATFAATKRALRAPLLAALETASGADDEVLDAWSSPQTQAAMRRFVESTLARS